MKEYEGLVQFATMTIRVNAKNKKDAAKKIKEKVEAINPRKLMDHRNLMVYEVYKGLSPFRDRHTGVK